MQGGRPLQPRGRWVAEGGGLEGALTEEFADAVEYMAGSSADISEDVQRRLFGLYQRAFYGMPPTEPPASMEVVQMEAWREAASLSADDAMREYIDLVASADASFLFFDDDVKCEKVDDAAHEAGGSATASIFDAARDGLDLSPFTPDDVTAVDETGMSALHHAVDAEQPAAVKALLAAEADVDVKDEDGSTPLHIAALLGSMELVGLLLDAGATTLAIDGDGKSPADLAQSEGHDVLASLMYARMREDVRRPLTAAESAVDAGGRAGVAQSGDDDGDGAGPLPLIDIGAFSRGDKAKRAEIAAAFDEAFCTVGFCQIRGYEDVLSEATISALAPRPPDLGLTLA